MPPLADDVILLILCRLPDFPSLASAIRTCKAYHGVWRIYPDQIMRSILRTIVGPAFPQALRLLLYENSGSDPGIGIELRSDAEADFAPTNADKEVLTCYADFVRDLRDMFATNYKADHPLNPAESYRFNRALYHLMLYCDVFGMDSLSLERWSSDRIEEARRKRYRFLKQFDAQELSELYAVVRFIMLQLVLPSMEDDPLELADTLGEDLSQVILSCGPRQCLQYYENIDNGTVQELALALIEIGSSGALDGFVEDPLTELLREREVDVDERMFCRMILDDSPIVESDS